MTGSGIGPPPHKGATAGFGERVRYFRTQRGIGAEELAKAVKRGVPMLYAIERGQRQIHVDELPVFARALDVPCSVLFDSDENYGYMEGFKEGYEAALGRIHRALALVACDPEADDGS